MNSLKQQQHPSGMFQLAPMDMTSKPRMHSSLREQFGSTFRYSALPMQEEPLDLSLKSASQSHPLDLTKKKRVSAEESKVQATLVQDPLPKNSQTYVPECKPSNERKEEDAENCIERVLSSEQCDPSLPSTSHQKNNMDGSSKGVEVDESNKEVLPNNESKEQPEPLACSTCSKAFSSRSGLKRHVAMHSKKKLHVCTICSKSFAHKRYLSQHLLIHNSLQRYVCDVCGLSFARKSALSSHAMIHSHLNLHSCDVCSKTFTRRNQLKAHMRTH